MSSKPGLGKEGVSSARNAKRDSLSLSERTARGCRPETCMMPPITLPPGSSSSGPSIWNPEVPTSS
eukprot:4952617-Amphidinium_carterae.1